MKTTDNDNAIIMSMTEEHNNKNIYDRIVGIPDNAHNRTACKNVVPGTLIYINYVKIGISKVVKAVSIPYIDNTPIDGWDDTERYAMRIDTEPVRNITNPVTPNDVAKAGIRYKTTGNLLQNRYARQSAISISMEDAKKLDALSSGAYWDTIDKADRLMRLYEITDNVIGAIGDEGMLYMDTTNTNLPDEWYYSSALSDLVLEGRDIMNSLGIEKMRVPTR